MSPFRSSAGPSDAADADAELLADDVREARLAEAGRPDEQHVVERLRARAGCLERDVELLLDPLLPDEVVEVVAAAASARARPPRAGEPERGTARSCRLQRLAHSLLGRGLGIGAGERAFRLDGASSRARRARRARRGRARPRARPARARASPSARGRRARRSSSPLRGWRGSARCRRARSSAAAPPASSRRRSAARPSARLRTPTAAARRARARPARRTPYSWSTSSRTCEIRVERDLAPVLRLAARAVRDAQEIARRR